MAMSITVGIHAQSYVTYNHDDAKMKQIQVMETGTGTLTPDLYYWTFHNSYKKSANERNKLAFRTLAGVSAWQQVEYADSIQAYLENRAKIEALNVADRQIDLAWRTEGSKIEEQLERFHTNINRIVAAGGSPSDRERWNTYYNMYKTAITATREAYMPNAQRKKEYLRIYADITRQNETLVKTLVLFSNKSKTEAMLACQNNYRTSNKVSAIATANGKWREAAKATSSSGGSHSSSGDEGEETVDR